MINLQEKYAEDAIYNLNKKQVAALLVNQLLGVVDKSLGSGYLKVILLLEKMEAFASAMRFKRVWKTWRFLLGF